MAAIRALALLVFVCACLAGAGPARAEEPYPSQIVRMVVPAAAGSTTDILTRLVADRLSQRWGKAVVVENISGGAMNVGAEKVARAHADGYTLLVAPPAPLAINQLLYHDLAYDPTRFAPITLLAKVPNVLTARLDLPAKTVPELIAYAKGNPDKVTYASQGVGSTAHLSSSQLEVAAGIKMIHVPYRGALPALTDVIAGRVDLFFDTATTSVPPYRGGQIRILAVGSPERTAALPEVPTMQEAGLPGFRSVTWFGLVAPPGTPAAIVEKINRDTVAILTSADVSQKLRDLRLDVGATSPEETAAFFAEETKLWGKVIAQAHVTLQ